MDVLAQVNLQHESGLPEDVFVNTFAFNMPGVDINGEIANIGAALDQFYSSLVGTQVASISSVISAKVLRTPKPKVLYYDRQVGGTPVGESDLLGFDAAIGTDSLPQEAAVCLSFHADLTGVAEEVPLPPAGPEGDQRPRARRRGRIYIGPLSTGALNGPDGRVESQFRTDIVEAAKGLRDDSNLSAGNISWQVWSDVDAVGRDVTGGWVDNAFDTQRRRGLDASVRTLF